MSDCISNLSKNILLFFSIEGDAKLCGFDGRLQISSDPVILFA